MTTEKLTRALEARPFRPFGMRPTVGRSLLVRSRQHAFILAKASRTFLFHGRREDLTIVDPLALHSLIFTSKRIGKSPRDHCG